ncbi:hypothetical protein J4468_04165 [Candidatus Woesearchaeota archaeon]|nr:hypothetical protein [Candidatus Woesearchaeota archaeon]
MKIPNKLKERLKLREREENEHSVTRSIIGGKRKERALERERQKLPKKITLCEKIFEWRNDFLNSSEGKKIFERCNSKIQIYAGCVGDSIEELNNIFQDTREGYEKTCYFYRLHNQIKSELYIIDEGIKYVSLVKSLVKSSPEDETIFKTPETMAVSLIYFYLEDVLASMEVPKVYYDILKNNYELNR